MGELESPNTKKKTAGSKSYKSLQQNQTPFLML